MRDVIRSFISNAYDFIQTHPEEWNLDNDVDLEVLNHVLRVYIQDGTIAAHRETVLRLCENQHTDGGWGGTRDDGESRLRSTAFCAQMLVRANRTLAESAVTGTIRRAVDYIVGQQLADGSWRDHRWHLLDAVSVSVGTLLFVVNEPYTTPADRQSLDRGMAFVRGQQQPDGAWYYKPTASPVTISAHLLQKCVTYGYGADVCVPPLRVILALQDRAGHWDRENIDHTCDASRSLMLTASTPVGRELVEPIHAAAERALSWVIDAAADGGLGDRPKHKPHVERTCDGVDFALKFGRFETERQNMLAFWR
jgi:prenyltransferase/squalene oxidase-like repeat protein